MEMKNQKQNKGGYLKMSKDRSPETVAWENKKPINIEEFGIATKNPVEKNSNELIRRADAEEYYEKKVEELLEFVKSLEKDVLGGDRATRNFSRGWNTALHNLKQKLEGEG
ncbi:hypothetical protein AKJ56_00360 [candidate division MSBL1 archaeon SCGC-AAA382N08]|uniref:Uncharacterized protein n=1 Tax=candidate division MSBL1 archaeon SCGC-AAA382N08 TaxID=1698285 RepID=A0A133VQQ2_9EURY|nr:hypothetical protein AKJ56_00360 [candidate division MSBL1 archaeon SCGC-AAA382N08]